MPHDNLGTPNFLMSGTVLKLELCHPQWGGVPNTGEVGENWQLSTNNAPAWSRLHCLRATLFSCHPVVFSYHSLYDTIRDAIKRYQWHYPRICLSSILLSFATVIQQAENAVWVGCSVQLFADYCNFHIKRTVHAQK